MAFINVVGGGEEVVDLGAGHGMGRAVGAGLITSDTVSGPVVDPAASVAVSETVNVPVTDGLPVITTVRPLPASTWCVSPAGSPDTVQPTGSVPPVTANDRSP